MKRVKVILTDIETGEQKSFDSTLAAVKFLKPYSEATYLRMEQGKEYIEADTGKRYTVTFPEEPPTHGIRQIPKKPSLCNRCGTNILECDWLQSFTPIKGWYAELVPYRENDLTYNVIECPLFEPFKEKKCQK